MIYSLLSLCSMRRWQYSKAFSRSLSLGGSSLLEEDVADTMDITELSTSERSSAATAQHITAQYNTQSTTPFSAGFKQARFLAGFNAIAGLSKWWDIKAMFGTAYYNSTIFTVCSMCNEHTMHILWIPTWLATFAKMCSIQTNAHSMKCNFKAVYLFFRD